MMRKIDVFVELKPGASTHFDILFIISFCSMSVRWCAQWWSMGRGNFERLWPYSMHPTTSPSKVRILSHLLLINKYLLASIFPSLYPFSNILPTPNLRRPMVEQRTIQSSCIGLELPLQARRISYPILRLCKSRWAIRPRLMIPGGCCM